MPKRSKSTQLSEEEKIKRRREQKKNSIRRARAKMSEADLEERRRLDRERYQRKKALGLVKTIKDMNPREQRQMRKIWREKAKNKREKAKINKKKENFVELNTPASFTKKSRTSNGESIAQRNRRFLKAENNYLKKKICQLKNKVSKYKMQSIRMKKLVGEKNRKCKKTNKRSAQETAKAVRRFLLQDENTRSTSGKKETITRHKIKKQIRFLNDSLINLHKTFIKKTGIQISYETFRRCRPFWVLFPKVHTRHTCLCIIHTNTNFLVQALYHAKIIPFKSATDLIKSLCCSMTLDPRCLENLCPNCKKKSIKQICNDFDNNDSVVYERWVTKGFTIIVKGTSKCVRKTVKEKIQTTKKQLLENLNTSLPAFMKHVACMIHQIKAIQVIKQQISPELGLLHIDFSENYNCKYSQEIQSAHFGGSKPQITLHTSVYYSTESDPPDNFVKTTSFCTVSENLRHDPILICVHLQALIIRIKELSPNLKHLHILSDGPSTQYRNKSMFHLMATYISKAFNVETITWHYSERGHGKGAPDGVGGCLKRICDSHVAKGNDVSDLDGLMSCLASNSKGIEVYVINESLIPYIEKKMNKSILKPFKGTREIHQLTWSSLEPTIVHARRLSCLECATHVKCPHYELGVIHVRSRSLNTPEEAPNSPALLDVPDIADDQEGLATPDASTMSVSPGLSDRLTPDATTSFVQVARPCKITRPTSNSEDSDSSLEIFPLSRRPPIRIIWHDSDESS